MEFDWQVIGTAGVYSIALLMCLIGFFLSCISLSGTWFVLAAAGLVAWKNWPGFPGWPTLLLFLLLCIAAEVVEAFAGAWGVQRRGGSRMAGLAAMAGGFLGLFLGGLVPIPVIGNLLGMLIGSFALAFLVEHDRMKKTDHALHVATGAVLARLSVIFIKVGITVGMTVILFIGIVLNP